MVWRVYEEACVARGLAGQASFQVGYTTVFGWYAMYLYLRTGHLAAPHVAHVFCNWMQFPSFPRILRHPRARLALPMGVLCFIAGLHPLTWPPLYNADAAPSDPIAPALAQAWRLGSPAA
jgi:prenyl protein peptidase